MIKRSTIFIAGDHKLFRETWSFILQGDERFSVLEHRDFGHDLEKTLAKSAPGIVLMDINHPDSNTLKWIQSVVRSSPSSKFIVISVITQPVYVRKLLQAGVMGYLTKNSSGLEIYDAMREVQLNHKYICKEIKEVLSNQMMSTEQEPQAALSKLSPKEKEIINNIVQGMSSREIAAAMNVSVKTVEVHRYNILKKSGMRNVAALVNYVNSNQVLVEA